MNSVLVFAASVIFFLAVPASAKEELQFQVKNVSPQYVLLLKGRSSVRNISQDMESCSGASVAVPLMTLMMPITTNQLLSTMRSIMLIMTMKTYY